MRRSAYTLLFSALCAFATSALAQDRSAELDKAVAETKAAYLALKQAEQRRDEGVTPEPGDRLGAAGGGTRASDQYLGRQALLEQEVELARRRYEAAQKRWNDLK